LLVGEDIYTTLIPTSFDAQETAETLLSKLLDQAKLERHQLGHVVGTGYGRISLKFDDTPYSVVTEISCHALGAHALVPEARTILDIGGQDSKAIKIDPTTGRAVEFVMNDKCAAGTGRFLEKAATLLGIEVSQLGEVALLAGEPAQISSQCVVFAESEMISLRARGEREQDDLTRANIAAGVHLSAARRVANLLGRVGLEPALVFTGGVSNNRGMWKTLESLLSTKFVSPRGIDMIYAGALGAAAHGGHQLKAAHDVGVTRRSGQQSIDVAAINRLVEEEERAIATSEKPRAGFLCVYTPLELFRAAGVACTRIMKAGDLKTVGAGELHTQSVLCDHVKSCIGGFALGHELHKSLQRVYNFHVCGNMKRATEIIHQFVPTTLLNVPKNRTEPASRELYADEIREFKRDLEVFTGKAILDEEVRRQITLYNQARRLLRSISELRKQPQRAITGREFLALAKTFYSLPPERLISLYTDVYQQLKASAPQGTPRLRLLIAGSVMGDGDHRILDIVEGELGAAVVAEDHCAGVRPFYSNVPEDGDPYRALADGYLDQAPCSNRKPMEDAVKFTAHLAREYAVDGVLYIYLKFCSCYGLTKKGFIDGLQALGLPVLDISSDYSQSDHGQLKTRIEAFIEILNERKEPSYESAVQSA